MKELCIMNISVHQKQEHVTPRGEKNAKVLTSAQEN